MKTITTFIYLAFVGCSLACFASSPTAQATGPGSTEASRARISEAYGRLPLSFEANDGQNDPQVKFLSRGSGYNLFLTNREAVLVLMKPDKSAAANNRTSSGNATSQSSVLRMKLVGTNRASKIAGQEELPGKVNYFTGNDPAKWRTGVPTYAKVRYEQVYPGIDLVYYGNQRQLEYDFVVSPGADPSDIRLGFAGAEKMRVDAKGGLVVQTAGGTVRWNKPVVYQEVDGNRRSIEGKFLLRRGHKVSFQVAAYDTSKPLVIDPTLVYSTYLGGTAWDVGAGIAVDSSGNAYLAIQAYGADFPTTGGAFQTAFAGGSNDTVVAKLNAAGSALVYSTYLGGSGTDSCSSIAVDAANNAYVVGGTDSGNFPITPGAFQTTHAGGGDAYLTKLNSTGSALVYSTYLGGSSPEGGYGIVVDSAGNAYVSGNTFSVDFPVTPGAFQTTLAGGGSDAFVAKLNSSASALVYSTYVGGSGYDSPAQKGLAVDSTGNAYITGLTESTNFPTTAGAFQTASAGARDTYVTKLNASGTALVYSTYLGGSSNDANGYGSIAVDSAGNAYVTGTTSSNNFPVTAGAFQTSNAGGDDAFVTELNATGSALLYSTYLGGNSQDGALGIAIDSLGNAWVAGDTFSTNLPTTGDAFQTSFAGGRDVFVSMLNAFGSGLVYSTYLGGNDFEDPFGIAVDSAGNAYVIGLTYSSNFPTTAGAFQTSFAGGGDAFVAKFSVHQYSAQVQPPINTDGTSVFTVRRGVVPVKFRLMVDGNASCDLPPATIAVTRTGGGVTGEVNESVYGMSADSGSNFRIDGCQYIYNLNSGALGAGTYRVDIMINGQVVGSGVFQLK